MNNALLVRDFEGFRDLPGDRQRFIEWNRPLRDAVRERRPFDQLHHQCAGVTAFLKPVDGRDVGMIERCQAPALPG